MHLHTMRGIKALQEWNSLSVGPKSVDDRCTLHIEKGWDLRGMCNWGLTTDSALVVGMFTNDYGTHDPVRMVWAPRYSPQISGPFQPRAFSGGIDPWTYSKTEESTYSMEDGHLHTVRHCSYFSSPLCDAENLPSFSAPCNVLLDAPSLSSVMVSYKFSYVLWRDCR